MALNQDDFITNELNSVNVGTAGSLEKLADSKLKVVPLLQSDTSSGLIDRDSIIFVRDPAGLLENFKSDGLRHIIAMRISGDAQTAFPAGRPPSAEEKTEAPDTDFVANAKAGINVIVVADTDLLADRFWVRFSTFGDMRMPQPFGNNGDFLINSIDNLGGNDDLISLRSRGQYTRPFEVVQQIQREAEAQFRDRQRALQDKLTQTEKKLAELHGEHSGKILGTEAVKAGILALDGDRRCAFALTDLVLERAFAAAADAGENEGVGRHSGRPAGLTVAQDLVRRSLQKGRGGKHGQDCIS